MNDTDHGRLIQLERADAAREALERAAEMLEALCTNEHYRKAMRKAAKLIRQMQA